MAAHDRYSRISNHPHAELVVDQVRRYGEAVGADEGMMALAEKDARGLLSRGQAETEAIKAAFDEIDFLISLMWQHTSTTNDLSLRALDGIRCDSDWQAEQLEHSQVEDGYRIDLTIRHIPSGERRIVTSAPASARAPVMTLLAVTEHEVTT